MTPDERRPARPICTYALAALDAQNAGSGAVRMSASSVVMCDVDVSVTLRNRLAGLRFGNRDDA
jgi:hypothetical protein